MRTLGLRFFFNPPKSPYQNLPPQKILGYKLTATCIYYHYCQVNNAGIVHKGTIENTSLEDYDKVMRINTR